MSCRLKIIGSEPRLREVLDYWKHITPTGGHTTVAFEPGTRSALVAADIYERLVTEYSFTPLNTTVADVPVKAPTRLPDALADETEYTFIPQYAGG